MLSRLKFDGGNINQRVDGRQMTYKGVPPLGLVRQEALISLLIHITRKVDGQTAE
jgi:hypothetical protein